MEAKGLSTQSESDNEIEKIKEQTKQPQNKRQTSKKILAFVKDSLGVNGPKSIHTCNL